MNVVNIQRCAGTDTILAALSTVGCTDKGTSMPEANVPPAAAAAIDPPTTVVGVEPRGPTREAPTTTSAAKSDISRAQQSSAMPMPGQANGHSTLSPPASQKTTNNGR